MSKTKTFERGHFWSNFVQTFFIWCQITKILRKIFFFTNWSNIGCFWWICLWKLMKGWSEISEIHTTDASCHAPKKTRKRQISPDSPSLWILIFKIYKYLPIFFVVFTRGISGKNLKIRKWKWNIQENGGRGTPLGQNP